jgi:hypothetical protein
LARRAEASALILAGISCFFLEALGLPTGKILLDWGNNCGRIARWQPCWQRGWGKVSLLVYREGKSGATGFNGTRTERAGSKVRPTDP